ncbi:type II secretion system minor pseudopilin GspK [Paraglaciecola sp. 2405UD69-4]|uniref:type II secretion system minor pseudopilin GspK n=1 Tax=Paraglaciecola sp. 2405UD69-4 TaxID=3391836 RepID=UPI0039C9EF2B
MTNRYPKQKGVALIIVLMIVAIVSVLATEMGSRLQLQIKRSSNIKDNNQAYWYAMSAEQYARKSIKDLAEQDRDLIYLDQAWNQDFVFPIDGGGIEAKLVDLQSCFNLNALRDPGGTSNNSSDSDSDQTTDATVQGNSSTALPDRVVAFQRLLELVDGDIPTYNVETVRDSLVDWLDDDDQSSQLGAEDGEYESLQFPYLPANNFLAHKSELRLIHGMEVKWLEKLFELVCVIPSDSLFVINVNTVTEENAAVIAAATGLSLADAQSVLSNRGPEGFQEVTDFLAEPSITALSLSDEQEKWFDVTTSYFMLDIRTKYNDATFAMQSVLKINEDNSVSVVSREFNGF